MPRSTSVHAGGGVRRSLSNMRAFLIATIATVFLAACPRGSHTTAPEDNSGELLPLTKGAVWTYKVKLLRYDADAGKEIASSLTWTTEVVDVIEGPVTVYVVKGWPSDLASFEDAPQPSESYLLRAGESMLWGRSREASVEGAEGWFSEPLSDGQRICPNPGILYCWNVADKNGRWELTFRTGPDQQTYRLRRGTGVVYYHYAHHGTLNEVTAELIDFAPGKHVTAAR